jgi:hypothetical protein
MAGRSSLGATSTTYWKSECYECKCLRGNAGFRLCFLISLLLPPSLSLSLSLSPFFSLSASLIDTRFGMSINSDSVTRSVFYKYLHPKEVYIAEGTLVPDVIRKKVSLISLSESGRGGSRQPMHA